MTALRMLLIVAVSSIDYRLSTIDFQSLLDTNPHPQPSQSLLEVSGPNF
jgi:hypothetical protein